MKPADNVLIVKADNTRRAEAVPTLDFDWWNYGGITRPVRLVEVPATFIRDYVVQLASEDGHRVRGWVQLDGRLQRFMLRERFEISAITQRVLDGREAGGLFRV